MGRLSNLIYMLLSDNRLTGVIPEEIGNIADLNRLYLHNNLLSGPVPLSFTNLSSLQRFLAGGSANNTFVYLIHLRVGTILFHIEMMFYYPFARTRQRQAKRKSSRLHSRWNRTTRTLSILPQPSNTPLTLRAMWNLLSTTWQGCRWQPLCVNIRQPADIPLSGTAMFQAGHTCTGLWLMGVRPRGT